VIAQMSAAIGKSAIDEKTMNSQKAVEKRRRVTGTRSRREVTRCVDEARSADTTATLRS